MLTNMNLNKIKKKKIAYSFGSTRWKLFLCGLMDLLIKQEPGRGWHCMGAGWQGVDKDQVAVTFQISGNIKKNGIIVCIYQQKYKEGARRWPGIIFPTVHSDSLIGSFQNKMGVMR